MVSVEKILDLLGSGAFFCLGLTVMECVVHGWAGERGLVEAFSCLDNAMECVVIIC